MSVVVAIKDNGKVYIGADSQVTKGGTRSSLSNPNNYKVWHVPYSENCLMGHVGYVRDANVVKVEEMVPEINLIKGNIDFRFMVKQFVPRLFDVLDNANLMVKDRDGIPASRSEYIFAYKDKLFKISGDGTVIEIDDYCAIGSGECEAIGSLLSTEKYDSIERIKMAIKASAANDIYVDYPIVIGNTEDDEFQVFTEKDFRDNNK